LLRDAKFGLLVCSPGSRKLILPAQKAKVLGLEPPARTELGKPGDFSQAKSVRDIGRMLLQQVDYAEPSDEAIEQAIAANEQFIETLQAIRDRALGLSVEQ
jgi:hypothetical protein